jgi:BCD family chlorophyll transporter-like MFS transporter
MTGTAPLGWLGIVRLGLVQTALGAIVVLTTSTLNRVMVVEIALPAIVPGFLVALHYAVQLLRPRLGYGSDVGGRRTPWIVGGMAVLASGGVLAAVATAWMASNLGGGLLLAAAAFVLIGLGVGASGTTLLVLLAKRTHETRRAAAATVVWVMMIAGFIVTAGFAGHLLDPFSPSRLVAVACGVAAVAMIVTVFAVWNIEGDSAPAETLQPAREPARFRQALQDVWRESQSRRFAIFVFVSMIAYSAQDLILEPFAGIAFGLSPGETTKLSGVQNGGVLAGMIAVTLCASGIGGRRLGSLRIWIALGCVASALALLGLVAAALAGPAWPLRTNVFALGFANGVYAVAAIGSMMSLVDKGAKAREGVRMGVWGAAQAIAFGMGGIIGTLASDLARLALGSPTLAYAVVFAGEAVLFIVAAILAAAISPSVIAGAAHTAEPGRRGLATPAVANAS